MVTQRIKTGDRVRTHTGLQGMVSFVTKDGHLAYLNRWGAPDDLADGFHMVRDLVTVEIGGTDLHLKLPPCI
jgi:hypothetical protein